MPRLLAALVVLVGAMAATNHAQAPAAGTLIRGRVVAMGTGTPLRSARVQDVPSASVPPVMSDAEGRFSLSPVSTSAPRIAITKPGYLPQQVTVADASTTLEVVLVKAGAIAGRITDTTGDAVSGRIVTAEVAAGTQRQAVATGRTNDLGDYRISGLAEGRYFVRVSDPSPPPPGRPRPADVYYPGTQSMPQSITMATGEERFAIDLVVPVEAEEQNRRPIGSEGTSTVRGRVLASDGRPLPRADVAILVGEEQADGLILRGVRPPIETDADGRFEFTGLPEGSFLISAGKTGYLSLQFGQTSPTSDGAPVELRRGEARSVDIILPRLPAITGRVVDDLGEPVERASIRVMQIRYIGGRRRLVDVTGLIRAVQSDDRGMYRVGGLAAGEYIVSASVGQLTRRIEPGVGLIIAQPAADLAGYATTFYPGTASPADALRVAIRPDDEANAVDIALVRAPTARITGRVVDASGSPLTDGLILVPSRRSGVLAASPVAATIDDNGNFEFANVPFGEYVIQANISTGSPFDEGESASQFVAVGGEEVAGVLVRLSRGSTLSGRVTIDGRAPESMFGVDLQAVAVDMDQTPQDLEGGIASAELDNEGAFQMAGLSGPRVIRLQSPKYALKAVLLNGIDVTDTPMPFGRPEQSVSGVEVVLTERVSMLTGRAVDTRGRPAGDALVMVFSTDRAHWGETSRFMAASRSARNGAFTFRNLHPGEYYAVAMTGVDINEWRDPELIEQLVPVARTVTLGEGSTTAQDLTALARSAPR